MFANFQWMELGCWDWTHSLCLFKLFETYTYFAQSGVTRDSFWLAISQQMKLGCWDWTQCLYLFKVFQNYTHFARFGVTGDSFWFTHAILSNYRFSYQTPSTLLFSNACNFTTDGTTILRLDSLSSSFQAVSALHTLCSNWCNKVVFLT